MNSYKKAGVNIDAGNAAVKRLRKHVKKTFNKTVVKEIGSFAGALNASFLKKFKKPLLVSTIDGVGTKVKIAKMTGTWHTVGADIVNHSSNDILALGASPLFFLDYIASSKIKPAQVAEIVRGMSIACKKLACPLIGGETAEMPGVYEKGEVDIAGCMVGVVDAKKIIDGSSIKGGDLLIGLASSGLHTNGYTLARKVLLKKMGLKKILRKLLAVHKSYSKTILKLAQKIELRGIAHITGGGLVENIPRILPKGIGAEIDKSSWRVPKIFTLIQRNGKVQEAEMYHTFNMGIGLVLFVSPKNASMALKFLKKRKEKAFLIGKAIKNRKRTVEFYG
ncbi:MAG: phosphoribosylformylglycinamidine cyclo-ligase [Candidatus Diapherotrites archaeon]|nr:phosphoribosylformylglycinamidine cyclo-ligase [Candidatus Diapherotrites archaeon]